MPKQILKIDQFHGGINDDADPRDIADNQFAALEIADVSHLGRIVVLGNVRTQYVDFDTNTPYITTAVNTPGGRGFIAIKTDYDGFGDGNVAVGGRTYYLIEDGDGVRVQDLDASEGQTFITVTNMDEAEMYYAEGAVRIYDADHETTYTPQWRGFIKANTYMPQATGGDAAITASWYTGNAQILGAFPEFTYSDTQVCKNALMLDVVNAASEQWYSFDQDSSTTTTDADYNGTTATATSDHEWGFALEYGTAGNGRGSWMKNSSVRYKFFITTMYDDHSQESLPQLLRMFGVDQIDGGDSFNGKVITTEMFLTNGDSASVGTMVDLYLMPVFKIIGLSNAYNFGATALEFADDTCDTHSNTTVDHDDDGGAIKVGMPVAGSGIPTGAYVSAVASVTQFTLSAAATSSLTNTELTFNTGGGSYLRAGDNGNKRISGTRIYWASNEDGYTDLWMLFDAKFDEGCKVIGVDGGGGGSLGYSPWVNYGSFGEHVKVNMSTDNRWIDPPKYFSYQMNNFHSHTELITVDSFKTSVYANRRMYIGNYEQDGKIRGDSMLKSPVGQLDKFPEELGRIDVAVNDGDEIVALMEYADRLLQFKKSSLYILNISGEYDMLESEHRFKGISNPGAVCRTDYGIAWANQNGCYLYDGKQIRDLLEDKGIRKINNTSWSDHIHTEMYERVGYNPSRRQICVTDGDNSKRDAYIYDIVTGSWMFHTNFFGDYDTGSPFVNDPETGTLLMFNDGLNDIEKWTDISNTDVNYLQIKTKDYDFGHPAVRKKIYKVYISYKGNGQNLTVGYRVNGENAGAPGTFYKITSATDGSSSGATDSLNPLWSGTAGTTDWLRAELKPVASINNVFSFQLVIGVVANADASLSQATNDFEINDISIVYRLKNIK